MWEKCEKCSYFLNSNDYEARHWNKEHTSYKEKRQKNFFSTLTAIVMSCKQLHYLSSLRLLDVNITLKCYIQSNLLVSDLTLVNLPCKSNFILSCNNTRVNSSVILLADWRKMLRSFILFACYCKVDWVSWVFFTIFTLRILDNKT